MIRPAGPGDIATIIALRALLFEAMGTSSSEEISDEAWQQEASRWVQLHLSDQRTRIVVAEVQGAVVSCAMGQVVDLMPAPGRTGEGGRIFNVATFPRHRRLGFTGAVFEALMAWFREETAIEVIAVNATEDGRSLYERFGFADATFPEMRLHLDRSAEDEEEDDPAG